MSKSSLLAIACLLVAQAAPAAPKAAEKEPQPDLIIGWVERISLPRLDTSFKAKIDTGATTSSIDAKIIDLPEEPSEDSMEEIESERSSVVRNGDEEDAVDGAAKGKDPKKEDRKKKNQQKAAAATPSEKQTAKSDIIQSDAVDTAADDGLPPLPPKRGEEAMPPRQTVIFSILDADGVEKIIERPLVRWVKIKKKAGANGAGKKKFVRRPVVNLKFCIAGRQVSGEVNLSDREHFTYPVLIGRNMLSNGSFLVDASREFQGKPKCVDG